MIAIFITILPAQRVMAVLFVIAKLHWAQKQFVPYGEKGDAIEITVNSDTWKVESIDRLSHVTGRINLLAVVNHIVFSGIKDLGQLPL